MGKIIIFGATQYTKSYLRIIKKDTLVLAIADNHYAGTYFAGHIVISPKDIPIYEYDKIVIGLDDQKPGNDAAIISIYEQLLALNVPEHKIVLQSFKYYFEHPTHKPRTNFIVNLAQEFQRQRIQGAVAECGVYRGWFSGVLSTIFKEEDIFLFDSFEGFSKEDIAEEPNSGKHWVFNGAQARLANTDEKIVLLRCDNRKRVHLRKGYVPETLYGIEEDFKFVNLDMDLYRPQKQALDFFSEHMVCGGGYFAS